MTPEEIFRRNAAWAKKLGQNGYTTPLSPREEQQFQQWLTKSNVPFDSGPTSDYDMRGFWKSGQAGTAVNPNDGLPHFPDTFKTPYHKSFSAESKYATPDAPTWNDKDQLIDKSGNVIFDERALTEGRSISGKLPPPQDADLYRDAPGTADDIPSMVDGRDRYRMPNFAKPSVNFQVLGPPKPQPIPLGGRGMPAMMPSSPPVGLGPDQTADESGSTSPMVKQARTDFPGINTATNSSRTPAATGQFESNTNNSALENAYSPDYRPQSQNMTFDIPSMLRTLFGTGA